VIFTETKRGRRRDEEPYFLYGDARAAASRRYRRKAPRFYDGGLTRALSIGAYASRYTHAR
jgi:hypothetical protein